jgi:phage tail protein X
VIGRFVDIVDPLCLKVIVCFVDIVDPLCLKVIGRFFFILVESGVMDKNH